MHYHHGNYNCLVFIVHFWKFLTVMHATDLVPAATHYSQHSSYLLKAVLKIMAELYTRVT